MTKTRLGWMSGVQRKLPIANGSFLEAQFQCFADQSAVIHHGQHLILQWSDAISSRMTVITAEAGIAQGRLSDRSIAELGYRQPSLVSGCVAPIPAFALCRKQLLIFDVKIWNRLHGSHQQLFHPPRRQAAKVQTVRSVVSDVGCGVCAGGSWWLC